VDRAIRPLFPEGYMNDTQVIINLISGEQETLPDAFAALAASTALTVSDIPFAGPISEVRVARIKGQYLVNPFKSDLEHADLDIIVAASMDDVVMVEGEAKEVSEKALIEAIKVGHEAIKVQCQAQLDLAEKVGEKAAKKRELPEIPSDETIEQAVADFAKDRIYEVSKAALDKQSRKERFSEIKDELIEKFTEEKGEEWMEENGEMLEDYFDKLKKDVIRRMVLDEKVRLDGRKPDEVRDIWCEVDYLPAAHGSGLFNRGETQALASLTLGTKLDQMMIDKAMELYYESFFLHYNFPPYSVGETKPLRGPSRREVGHANLASRSLRQVLPDEIPYTVRIVSDVLESNGSSSMATVCAGSMALMDAGIRIKSAVSGIAMGLISDGEHTVVLSDILGDEDALGDMDFKVAGTEKGITGCQMDIKLEGMPYDLLEEALEQARKGRMHILGKMAEAIAEPREDLKPHAPRIEEVIIDKSFIGAVIGPGGKVVQEIQEETGTTINIEEEGDKGIVSIASSDKASIDAALARIRRITFTPTVGDVYQAKVKTVMPYGVFVEFNGKSGLLHVSEFSHSHIDKVEDVFSEGDDVKVKLIGIDKKTGKLRLSRKALLPPPNGDNKGGDNRRRGGGGGKKGGRR
jgi:polyribonucleotide nucleotidyltransferase